jgi:hypothetical protein
MTHVSAPPDLIRRALPGERGMVVALGLSSRANGRECQGGQPRYVCYVTLPPPRKRWPPGLGLPCWTAARGSCVAQSRRCVKM